MKAISNLAVQTGEYINASGQSKKRWQTIGQEFEAPDGGRFILLDPLFNLAALPRPAGRDRVMVSKFPVENNRQQQDDGRPY